MLILIKAYGVNQLLSSLLCNRILRFEIWNLRSLRCPLCIVQR